MLIDDKISTVQYSCLESQHKKHDAITSHGGMCLQRCTDTTNYGCLEKIYETIIVSNSIDKAVSDAEHHIKKLNHQGTSNAEHPTNTINIISSRDFNPK